MRDLILGTRWRKNLGRIGMQLHMIPRAISASLGGSGGVSISFVGWLEKDGG